MVADRRELTEAELKELRPRLGPYLAPGKTLEASLDEVAVALAEYDGDVALGVNDRPLAKPERERVARELKSLAEAAGELESRLTRLSEPARELLTAYAKVAQVPGDSGPSEWAPLVPSQSLSHLHTSAAILAGRGHLVARIAESSRSPRGRAPDPAAEGLTACLAEIWTEATGSSPVWSNRADDSTGTDGGPWGQFVSAVFQVAGIGAKGPWNARQFVKRQSPE
jgi:hypothetical protein